jgi:hypothetical protein
VSEGSDTTQDEIIVAVPKGPNTAQEEATLMPPEEPDTRLDEIIASATTVRSGRFRAKKKPKR